MKITSLAVVLFAYDEKLNLGRLLRSIHKNLQKVVPGIRLQYAVCIQGTDGTLEEAKAFMGNIRGETAVRYSHFSAPIGVRAACVEAFRIVEGTPDAVLMMDCDFNHQPDELPRFFAALQENTVVVGSRFCRGGRIVGMPIWKHILSVCFNYFTSLIFNIPAIDKTSGYRLISGPGVKELAEQVEGIGFDFYIEFLIRLFASGRRIVEVPICFNVRTQGVSKMRTGKTIINYIQLLWRLSKAKYLQEAVGRVPKK